MKTREIIMKITFEGTLDAILSEIDGFVARNAGTQTLPHVHTPVDDVIIKPTPEKTSRRRTTSVEEVAPVADDASSEEIKYSDQDISRAASNAAKRTSPVAVKEILKGYGVNNVAKLTQPEREDFVAQVALLEEA
tara:strand:+ start:4316 stop:4720 length:405 start_codon:yes stop_codon:yes gene_type:complete